MKRLPNWIISILISIFIIAVVLRLLKLYDFVVWGSDFGEHYYLLNQLINTGQIKLSYSGWGLAYPYFPGMHIFSSSFVMLSNSSNFTALVYVTPITAGLSVFLIFCIAHRVFRDPRIGLVAAGFIAVVMPHVFYTSHPVPGSFGSLLLLGCIFLLLKSYENPKFLILLGLTTCALVITHHMSTYFLIIILILIILVRELLQHPKDEHRTWIDFGYLIFIITITLIYWLVYAVPFRDRILANGIPLPIWTILPLAYFALAILYLIIHIRRRFSWHLKIHVTTVKGLLLRMTIFLIFGSFFLVVMLFTRVPGTDMKLDSQASIEFIPIIVFLSFMAVSPILGRYYKDGLSILAWLGAISLSVLISTITQSQELLTYRHIPYAFESLSILIGFGIVKIYDLLVHKTDSTILFSEDNKELVEFPLRKKLTNSKTIDFVPLRLRITAAVLIIILLFICATLAYPPLGALSGFEEGTTENELALCFWADEHLEDDATVASDHRMSSMVFGFAQLNSSWEYAPNTLHGESLDDFQDEVTKVSVPAGHKRLDYILLSDAIKSGVTLKQWDTAEPMSEDAIQKFKTDPFIKIFDNGEAQLYRIGDVANVS